MPIYKLSGIQKGYKMNTKYSKEFISCEIADLFNSVEEFVTQKDAMVEAIRYLYLNTACNN